MKAVFGLATSVLIGSAALAGSVQPYAGLETRPIKTLSDQQIADLNAGRGMGLALAAELNGYPGPKHVIELAEPLNLTQEQLTRVRGLFAAMTSETIAIGRKLISQETGLNEQFASRRISPESLDAATRDIGETQAALRAAHLRYHLSTAEILSPKQIKHYAQLRGYAGSGTPDHHHHGN
jgi:Spy/CpxP family protein refolding chaperone